jgi:Cathepsin propeptide inhibitor domain (I29)
MMKSLATLFGVLGTSSAFEFEGLGKYMGHLAKMGKSYDNLDQFAERLANFNEIDTWIEEYNADFEMTATMGHNQFSDWSQAERSAMFGSGPPKRDRHVEASMQ